MKKVKKITEHYKQLDIRLLKKQGLLKSGYTTTLSWSIAGQVVSCFILLVKYDRLHLIDKSNHTNMQEIYFHNHECHLATKGNILSVRPAQISMIFYMRKVQYLPAVNASI